MISKNESQDEMTIGSSPISKIISYESNDISVINVENENWFKGADIARILGYANTKQALLKNVDSDDRCNLAELLQGGLSQRPPSCNVQPHTVYINESGLYSLILSSKKDESKKFKRWITKEVLPSLRKYSTYSVNTN